jgi:hypothetical protein
MRNEKKSMFRRFLVPLAVILVPVLVGPGAGSSGETVAAQPSGPVIPQPGSSSVTREGASRRYTVWVFRCENGIWEKEEDRTLTTDDEKAARKYASSVNGYAGWTATSNLPTTNRTREQPANPLVGTRWTYFGSLEGCIFEFLSGNRMWATNYPQLGTWKVDGTRLTIEIENPFGEGVNVYTGNLEPSSRDLRLQVIRSPYPGNIGREVILKRLPLPGFT